MKKLNLNEIEDNTYHCKAADIQARTPIDFPIQLSSSMFWSVDYKERKHLFIWSPITVILSLEDYGNFYIAANTWQQIDFPAGLRIFSNTNLPFYAYVKATDEYILDNDNDVVTPNTFALTNNTQVFTATTGVNTTAGAIVVGSSLFNPTTSTKTLVVFSIKIATASSGQHSINQTIVDPALASPTTVSNNKLGSTNLTHANATFQNTAVTPSGTLFTSIGTGGNNILDVLLNNDVIFIPPGNGLLALITTATNSWQCTYTYIEQ